MISVLLLGLLAAASAAPRFHGRHSPFYDDFRNREFSHPSFGDSIFDTGRFWSDLETEMRQVNEMIQHFHQHFPTFKDTAGVEDNQYKIRISLPGFEEKDIVVKARDGVVMVQAVHQISEGIAKSFVDVRNLPSNVDVRGVWTFKNDLLTIDFPLKNVITTEAPTTTESFTIRPKDAGSREEMDKSEGTTGDADVGVLGSDSKENEIETHGGKKSPVEATTYAVDLKNEVEFVPVHYR